MLKTTPPFKTTGTNEKKLTIADLGASYNDLLDKPTLDNIADGTTYAKVTIAEKSVYDSKQDSITASSHIIDANGTIEDITTKFNTLLAQLETLGILAGS